MQCGVQRDFFPLRDWCFSSQRKEHVLPYRHHTVARVGRAWQTLPDRNRRRHVAHFEATASKFVKFPTKAFNGPRVLRSRRIVMPAKT